MVALAGSALLAWAFNLYLTPGRSFDPPWPAVLGRTATREGLALGLLLTLRMAGAITALQGLRAAWPGEEAADTAARWLAPLERLHVPVGETRAMIGLSLRFMPLLQSEALRITRVQDLRAGRPPRGAREWMQRRRAAAVPVMVGALERAERVALALEARHYRLRPAGARSARAGTGGAGRRAAALAGVAGVSIAALALLWRS
jgi:energy-coupling factor transport system permease protein